ncbi:isopenicillin N synthase family dioxygenase [[Mycobacterium] vasticus]|uniref:2-oxoglutarate and iron-dependent oxygenase domain-containing protein n=1 Tax=[Mycobacterium] vasticus TaxID=2875777 RepID=A0ABU5YVV7_9MYCO|nr:2-oxoglutarate and iron-dependent oxygenase domain-containing protein [Mycolicibacter sp. MYC017]MEB3069065.1 2-oxoglutarate and iron-dependent oxygenase domain-containing protein [Mycolicibacter sp. MYC017]
MLPVVNLTLLDDAEERIRLREITHTSGFFYLVGHGVSSELIRALHAVAQEFFARPPEDKLAIELSRSPHFRGYSRVGGELTNGEVDWREQIDFGPELEPVADPAGPQWLRGPNQWPRALPGMAGLIGEFQSEMDRVALELLRGWATSLGSPSDVFDSAFGTEPASLMKLIHYPQRPAGAAGDQGVGAHKDPGVLTLLCLQEHSTGLQVQALGGQWIDAAPMADAFIVNIGELLEVSSRGYLRATPHRVLTPAAAPSRISIPYFFGPALGGVVPTLELPADLAAKTRPISHDAGNQLHSTYGENMWKAKARAHPDVFARWHGGEAC